MKLKNNTLDVTDYKILAALQEDAKQTYTAIGKLLGIAHSTVYERIKRMEKHEIIKKYTAIVNAEKTGAKNITAMMTITQTLKKARELQKNSAKHHKS